MFIIKFLTRNTCFVLVVLLLLSACKPEVYTERTIKNLSGLELMQAAEEARAWAREAKADDNRNELHQASDQLDLMWRAFYDKGKKNGNYGLAVLNGVYGIQEITPYKRYSKCAPGECWVIAFRGGKSRIVKGDTGWDTFLIRFGNHLFVAGCAKDNMFEGGDCPPKKIRHVFFHPRQYENEFFPDYGENYVDYTVDE